MSPADEFSLASLMSRFREFDRREFTAMVPDGTKPFSHLCHIVNETELCWSLSVDGGEWHGVGGVGHNGENGCPWLLLSPTLPLEHKRAFMEITRRINQIFFDHYAPLANYVHAESESHRWLTWLGYTIHAEPELTFKDEQFKIFTYGI